MKIRIKVDTNCTTDLLAIRDLLDYYLAKPDETTEDEVFAVDSYGGIVRSTADHWRNVARDVDDLERNDAGDSLLALYQEHENKVMNQIVKGALDALIYGHSSKPPGGLADLVNQMRVDVKEHELDDPQVVGKGSPEKKPPKDTELIDNAIKKRSLTDDWDRYR